MIARLFGQTSIPIFETPVAILDLYCRYLGMDAFLSNILEQLLQICM